MAKLKGLELLYNLLLKDAVKTSGPRSGILSIGPDTRKFAQKRFEAFVEGAKKQGVDLDKYTEQELKYILELNKKPKSPKAISADSPEGKRITQGLMDMLDKYSGKNVIKADFGKSFKESITDDIIRDINDLESIPAMKEVNKVIKREGKYKNLTDEDVDKIFKGTEDRTSGRLDDVDPEDMATGGRAGFKDGMSRRRFLQIMGGLGSIPILGKFLKFGKAAKVVNPVKTPIVKLENTTTQMPEWFPSFVNKFRNEGKAENVFKQKKVEVSKAEYDKAIAEGKGEKYGTDVARTEEYKANNPNHMDYFKLEDTDELLYTKYTNENVPGVQVDDMKGEVEVLFENDYSQPVTINYTSPGKKGPNLGRADEILQDIATKETKQKGDFAAVDADVRTTSPDGDYDVEPVITETLDEMMEGTTRTMEEYATGKKVKGISKGEKTVIENEIRAETAAEQAAEAADDFASGGIARMLGE